MKMIKKVIVLILSMFIALSLVGCYDLGEFENEDDYYGLFGDIRLVYFQGDLVETQDYSVKEYFYNSNTVNNFTYGYPDDDEDDSGKDIPSLSYVYMAIPLKDTTSIDSLSLYLNGEGGRVYIKVYLVDSLPDGGSFDEIKACGDPEYSQKTDEDGNPIFDEEGNPVYDESDPISYSDPDDSYIVAERSILVSNSWNSFTIESWLNGQESLEVSSGQYLLIRFDNNSGMGSQELSQATFKTTNLLVRVKN